MIDFDKITEKLRELHENKEKTKKEKFKEIYKILISDSKLALAVKESYFELDYLTLEEMSYVFLGIDPSFKVLQIQSLETENEYYFDIISTIFQIEDVKLALNRKFENKDNLTFSEVIPWAIKKNFIFDRMPYVVIEKVKDLQPEEVGIDFTTLKLEELEDVKARDIVIGIVCKFARRQKGWIIEDSKQFRSHPVVHAFKDLLSDVQVEFKDYVVDRYAGYFDKRDNKRGPKKTKSNINKSK